MGGVDQFEGGEEGGEVGAAGTSRGGGGGRGGDVVFHWRRGGVSGVVGTGERGEGYLRMWPSRMGRALVSDEVWSIGREITEGRRVGRDE